MKLHILQHVPYETPGAIIDWANENSHTVSFTNFYEESVLPEINNFDFLVIMGGPMNIYDELHFRWLADEKKFIESAVNSGKKILGVCLGAQLIADVLGSKVYRNKFTEIGWFPINAINGNNKILNNIPKTLNVFHWHGDTFDIPSGAVRLAESEACPNQAFLYSDNVLALQFHLEMQPVNINLLIDNSINELVPDKYIQTADEMKNSEQKVKEANRHLFMLLDNLTGQ